MRNALNDAGIRLRSYAPGNHTTICPFCSHTRKKKTDPCLSVKIDAKGAVANCHHCGWTEGFSDKVGIQSNYRPIRPAPVKPAMKPTTLSPQVIEWFKGRGISQQTLSRNGISLSKVWMPGPDSEVWCIAFPYTRDGEVVNVKYRDPDKHFRQEKGAEKVLYGMDNAIGSHDDHLVWVEGEMDVLALNECGIWNVVSVPDGAPKQAKDDVPNPEDDTKFEYVWNCREFLSKFTRHILAFDMDAPGRALEEEISRRLGKENCWRVTWPEKDANDTLLAAGKDGIEEAFRRATPYPIKSLFEASQYEGDVIRLFHEGKKRGLSVGFDNIDPLMTIRPGELSVVTGYPSSGKSEFVDACAVNMAIMHGWKFAVCSFENPPDEHIAKWSEKYVGKPFNEGPTQRMTKDELTSAISWVNDHFVLIRAEDESPTIDWVLEKAGAAVMRHGINGLMLDPYNEFEHRRPAGMSETEYVSQMLSKVKRFAQSRGVHVWFVAHPSKPPKDHEDEAPTLYDISGSAHWVNKADLGVSVHRPFEPDGRRSNVAEIHVRKVRFRACGEPGIARLEYLTATGRYKEF
jgi:twinkle protein